MFKNYFYFCTRNDFDNIILTSMRKKGLIIYKKTEKRCV